MWVVVMDNADTCGVFASHPSMHSVQVSSLIT